MKRTNGTPPAKVRLLVLDVDGVLSDGGLYYGADGEQLLRFHVRDGHGIKAVQRLGIKVAIISGRNSLAAARRCRELGLSELRQGVTDKAATLAELCATLGVTPAQTACVGDDTPDVPMLQAAGLAVAVADAHREVLAVAHRRTRKHGGLGAVREVCDWLTAAQVRKV